MKCDSCKKEIKQSLLHRITPYVLGMVIIAMGAYISYRIIMSMT